MKRPNKTAYDVNEEKDHAGQKNWLNLQCGKNIFPYVIYYGIEDMYFTC